MVKDGVVQADFVGIKPIPTRSSFQIVLEIAIEEADAALKALGGFPIPGTNRVVCLVLQKD